MPSMRYSRGKREGRTIRLRDGQFLRLGVELDFELGMLLAQGLKLLNHLVEPLSQSNRSFRAIIESAQILPERTHVKLTHRPSTSHS